MWQSFAIFWLLFLPGAWPDCGCKHLKRDQDATERKRAQESCDFESSLNKLITNKDIYQEMSYIPTNVYTLGTDNPFFEADRESPERKEHIAGFYMDKFAVSNRDFEEFVREMNYLTVAEEFGDSFVFGGFLDEQTKIMYNDYRVLNAEWWFKINGTSWKTPEGEDSELTDRWDHPVVHVSWHDARAFCDWKQKRLPSESEWEAACRGNKKRRLFPWGDNITPKSEHWMNIWQGDFPSQNTAEDGFAGTCSVFKFRQNDFDMHSIVGNVWEWVENLWDAESDKSKSDVPRVKKGGSYLCHSSYCYRYRCAARSQNTADSSAGNLGFRCAKSEFKSA